ncbi:UNVERIFIED_CONTAM: hypothetical protein FKN15_028570 [Acipenser sinensis]
MKIQLDLRGSCSSRSPAQFYPVPCSWQGSIRIPAPEAVLVPVSRQGSPPIPAVELGPTAPPLRDLGSNLHSEKMSSIRFGSSIIQQLSFSSGGEEDSCDSSVDDWSSRENSPKAGWRMTKECQSPRASENKEGLAASPCTPRGSRTPTRDCHGTPTSDCHGTPLHYATWRKLRLCDSPNTPKSLLSKARVNSSSKFCRGPRILRFTARADPAPSARIPSVNVNPFTPEPFKKPSERHKRKSMEDEDEEGRAEHKRSDQEDVSLPSKRFALHENMVSRYETEFLELERIGAGEFGAVYKCVKRLDGCLYAIKRSKRPLAGSTDDWKIASLDLIVYLLLPSGGSLQDAIAGNAVKGHFFQEPELKEILLQVSMGLKYIHSSRLVHLDIKPSNIFVCRRAVPTSHLRGEDGESEEEDSEDYATDVVYKIGDLGHVASTTSPHVEEGDIRFLASEILQEDYSHLHKADIFALGLTVILAAGAESLPKNGEEWHQLRRGSLPTIPQELSMELHNLLKMLIHSDVSLRPSASGLCRHPVLRRGTGKTAAQLLEELKVEKFRTAMLERELKEARLAASSPPKDPRYIRHVNRQHDSAPRQGGRRLIGGKASRSMSFNCVGY